MSPQMIELAIQLALQLATQAGELFGKIGAAQAGGPAITDADIDAALATVAASRKLLVDAKRKVPKT